MANLKYDVLIVGAGPAGSTAAMHCAREGLEVLMLEKCRYPGEKKVCAGGLSSLAMEIIESRDFLYKEIKGTVYYGSGAAGFASIELPGTGLNTYRNAFDSYLANMAVEAGARLELNSYVTGLSREESGDVHLTLRKSTGELAERAGKIVIIAEGVNAQVARAAGLADRRTSKETYLAAQYEMKASKSTPDYNSQFFGVVPVGYGWVFPKPDGLTVGVCCLLSNLGMNIKEYLDRFVRKHPVASKMVGDARIHQFQAGLIPCAQNKGLCENNIMVVGDAAGFASPFTGEGIPYAILSGKIAANTALDAIGNGEFSKTVLSEYRKYWDQRYGRILKRQSLYFRFARHLWNEFIDALILEMKRNDGLRSIIRAYFREGVVGSNERLRWLESMLALTSRAVLGCVTRRLDRLRQVAAT
mgnify:CR=1 FL=1